MTITTRFSVAAAVAALRQIDARHSTDRAIAEVAALMQLPPEDVAQIAQEFAHTEALEAQRRRGLPGGGAHCLGRSHARMLGAAPHPQCGECSSCGHQVAAA